MSNDRRPRTGHSPRRAFLADKEKTLVVWTHFSLCNLEEKAPESLLKALAALLKDPDAELRIEAARALCMLGAKAAPQVDAITEALQDKNPNVVGELAKTLVYIGDSKLSTMLMLTDLSLRKDIDPGLREDILTAIDHLKKGTKP